jgi:hypothetical protein
MMLIFCQKYPILGLQEIKEKYFLGVFIPEQKKTFLGEKNFSKILELHFVSGTTFKKIR